MNGSESVPVPMPRKEVADKVVGELGDRGVRYGETPSTLLVPSGLVKEVMKRGGAYAQDQKMRVEAPLDDKSLQEIEISHPKIYDSIVRELSDRRIPFIKNSGALTICYSGSNFEAVREVVDRYVETQYEDLDKLYGSVFASLKRHDAVGQSAEQVEIPLLDKCGAPILPEPQLTFDTEEALRRREDRQRSLGMNAMRADAPWPKTIEEFDEERIARDLEILFSSANP